ncbi:RagB/SusD family nutrient uptake outer membrane protein [Pseudoflavitalea sp. G-6-1-2]|uniref:RagB/SusD family nutrient uptake outer membrane protein n=1 Tax=Pseudoflavitalea sp. G-6-1-2 TaxID=2728841 RepID=UPI00146A3D57|nr:RagB/SusD family nutrient uptake outer membrane protein [Pseudoflavitalea sp. G-6-1-2]NML21632.1 RagB/SusD family nutrient uptake outer membrane protein [Pseudoflavitalea sp. G-6-1-2]
MKKHCLLLLMIAISFSSCKKFLEERTQSDMTPETTEDFSQLLMGTGYPIKGDVFNHYLFLMDDDIQAYSNDEQDELEIIKAYDFFSWQPDAYQRSSDRGMGVGASTPYQKYFSKIMGCNIALQNGDKSLGNQVEKDQLMGEAYALRAYYYFHLVNLYGQPYNDSTTTPDKSPAVPLVVTANLSEGRMTRNSVAEIYAQIEKDVDSSVVRLKKSKKETSIYRINHLAAAMLASRTYLFTEKWDKVIENASYVLNSKMPLLDLNSWDPNYDPLMNNVSKPIYCEQTPETLWLFGWPDDYNGNAGLNMFYDVSEDLVTKFEPTDLRSKIYFFKVPDWIAWVFKMPVLNIKRAVAEGNFKQQSGGSFRVTEALLNRAEAYAQKYSTTGDATFATKALADLNLLRSKRFKAADFVPVPMMPAADLVNFCREEKRREMFGENMRWFDLRRYGMPSISHSYAPKPGVRQTYVLKKRDPMYLYQIPIDAMEVNPRLIQNPNPGRRNPS